MSENIVHDQMMISGINEFASQEAEESIISALISGEEDVQSIVTQLAGSDFFYSSYGKVFDAIKAASIKGHLDMVTVDAEIMSMFPSEGVQISNAMMNCISARFMPQNVEDYVRIIKDFSVRRQTIAAVTEIIKKLKDPSQNLNDVMSELQTKSRSIETSKHEWKSMADIMIATYDYLEKRASGQEKVITTGISNVDDLIGGFFGGELTLIGARPSVGKSAFGANIAIKAAKKGFKVAILSREMTDIQFGQRLMSNEALIDGMKLRRADLSEEDWSVITDSMVSLSSLPISFMFTVRTVEDLRRECQKKVNKGELDILIVDYLQLMHTETRFKEEHLRVGYISKALKDLATDFNIPVIALAQVNRDTDGQMPTLKSLKASGDMEQDADGVIFLHRPADANDAYVDPRDKAYFNMYAENGLTYICIGVAKQRQGVTGKACVLFDSQHMMYTVIDRGE